MSVRAGMLLTHVLNRVFLRPFDGYGILHFLGQEMETVLVLFNEKVVVVLPLKKRGICEMQFQWGQTLSFITGGRKRGLASFLDDR
jgi:hypothetical protein